MVLFRVLDWQTFSRKKKKKAKKVGVEEKEE